MRSSTSRALPVVALTAAGAALRILTLNTRSFWLDEATSIRQASWSIPSLISRMADNVHPPLFHLLLHFWIRFFGRAEIAARCFPLLFGIIAIPLAYAAGRSLFDHRVGLYSAAVLAFMPYYIWYAQEVRMYTLMLVFALISTASLWKAMERRRAGWWALYAVSTAAGMMTQYFFVFLLFMQAIYVLLFRLIVRERDLGARGERQFTWRRPWRVFRDSPESGGWLLSMLVVIAPQLWWMPKVLSHPDLWTGGVEHLHYGSTNPKLALHFNELLLSMVESGFGFHSGLVMRDLSAMWPLLVTVFFITVGFAKRARGPLAYLLVTGAGGASLMALVGQFEPVLEVRYFTAVSAPLVVLAAAFLTALKPKVLAPVLAVLLTVAAACYVDQSYNPDSIVKWDNRQAISALAAGYRPGDTILVLPYFASSIVEYYLPSADYVSVRKIPLFGESGARRDPPELDSDLDRMVGTSKRVWVVSTWLDKPRIAEDRANTVQWLRSQGYSLRREYSYRQIGVALFEAPAARPFFVTTAVQP